MGRLTSILLCFASFLLSSQIVASNTSVITPNQVQPHQDPLPQIQLLRKNGNLDEAKTIALDSLKTHPENNDVMMLLGLIYLQQQNYLAAELYLTQVLLKVPTYMDARVGLITTKMAERQYQTALELIQEGLKQQPENAQLKEFKATISKMQQASETIGHASFNPSSRETIDAIQQLRKQNKLDEASDLTRHYLKENPNDIDVVLELALIYSQQKNYPQAELYFHQVLLKVPRYTDAQIGLVRVKIDEKKYDEADELINDYLKLEPGNNQLKDYKALATKELTLLKQPKDALPAADQGKTLASIQALRNEGKLIAAKNMAVNYLSHHPEDVDIRVVAGSIFMQQKNYLEAAIYFKKVLSKVPSYLDARIGLININVAEKKFAEAMSLVHQGLEITPSNAKLQLLKQEIIAIQNVKKVKPLSLSDRYLLKAQLLMTEKKFAQAKAIYLRLLNENPDNSKARIALADYYLNYHLDFNALKVIQQGLQRTPDDTDLLVKLGTIQSLVRFYALAAHSYQQVLAINPQQKQAKNLLDEISEISPRYTYGLNEIGISSDNSYVSDLKSIWDLSTVYLSRETNYGRVTAKINYASRLGSGAPQYELDFSPKINRNLYFELVAASSDQPVLFPKKLVGIEGFANLTQKFQISGGTKYSNLGRTYFSTYTGSLNFYPNNYWFSFRPYLYIPKDNKNSLLYTGVIRRYFKTDDHYLGITAGTGRSPDLADLLTVNFLIIKNSFVSLNYEFPLFQHRIIVDMSVAYLRWQYPAGLVRNLYDGNIGMKYRF